MKYFVSLFAYLGLAPILRILNCTYDDDLIRIHTDQALVLFFWLFLFALIFLLFAFGLSVLVVFFPDMYQSLELELWYFSLLRKVLLCWGVFVVFGIGSVFLGSTTPLPVVSVFVKSRMTLRISVAVGFIFYTLFIVTFICVVFINSLIYPRSDVPKVYLLYDNLGYVPEWFFKVSFFPVILAGSDKYGKGKVTLRIISKENLKQAMKDAEYIFIASHGLEDGIMTREGFITPNDFVSLKANDSLKLVYLSSCKSGTLREQWERVFAPARVITYGRMTATFEHLLWFWISAPSIIRGN